jgi:hypothetical protein
MGLSEGPPRSIRFAVRVDVQHDPRDLAPVGAYRIRKEEGPLATKNRPSKPFRSRLVYSSQILEPKPVVGLIFATGEAIMSEDRMFVTGAIALDAVSTALAVWVIFSI